MPFVFLVHSLTSKDGIGLSPAKQFYASLQDVSDRSHVKGKLPVQGSAAKPPMPSDQQL
jgi:hypothetical protein